MRIRRLRCADEGPRSARRRALCRCRRNGWQSDQNSFVCSASDPWQGREFSPDDEGSRAAHRDRQPQSRRLAVARNAECHWTVVGSARRHRTTGPTRSSGARRPLHRPTWPINAGIRVRPASTLRARRRNGTDPLCAASETIRQWPRQSARAWRRSISGCPLCRLLA